MENAKLTLHLRRTKHGSLVPEKITIGEHSIPVVACQLNFSAKGEVDYAEIRISMWQCDLHITEEMENASPTDSADL